MTDRLCRRCGKPITLRGKTGMCRPCNGHFVARKHAAVYDAAFEKARKHGQGHARGRREPPPVTLAKPTEGKL